jgi:adenylate cyclase
MNGATPTGVIAAPLLILGCAVLFLVFNPLGLETALAERLFAAYLHAGAPSGPHHPLLPARLAEALWLLLFGGGAVALLPRGLVWSGTVITAGVAGAAWGGWLLYRYGGIRFDAATPGLSLLLLFLGLAAAWAVAVGVVRQRLLRAFAGLLPRASIEKIARDPSLLKSGGEARDCTYLVCGVRGLPVLAETFRDDPASFTRMLGQLLPCLMDQAQAHGGTLERISADGFAAFWNAPLDDDAHAAHACDAASGMAAMAARVNDTLAQQRRSDGAPLPMLEIGIGIATGGVIAGAFGGRERLGYGVQGPAVTLAQRIQALSAHYGPSVIVSGATRDAAERSFAFLEVDSVTPAMGEPPVTLHAVIGTPVLKASPSFRALSTFHDHIFQALRKQQWGQARALIEQCRKLSGASPRLYDLHLRRIGTYESEPPGESWDGVFRPLPK